MNIGNFLTQSNPSEIGKQLSVIMIVVGIINMIATVYAPLRFIMVGIDGVLMVVVGALLILGRRYNDTPKDASNIVTGEKNMTNQNKELAKALAVEWNPNLAIGCSKCHNTMTSVDVKDNPDAVELYCNKCKRQLIVRKANIKVPIKIINEGEAPAIKALKFIGAGAANVSANLTDRSKDFENQNKMGGS